MRLSTLKMTEVITKCFYVSIVILVFVPVCLTIHDMITIWSTIIWRLHFIQKYCWAVVASAQWVIAAALFSKLLTVSSCECGIIFIFSCLHGLSCLFVVVVLLCLCHRFSPCSTPNSFTLVKIGPILIWNKYIETCGGKSIFLYWLLMLFLPNEESWVRSQRMEREETGLAAMAVVYKIEHCSKIMNVLMVFWIVNHRFHSFEGQREFKRQRRTECSFENNLKWRSTALNRVVSMFSSRP